MQIEKRDDGWWITNVPDWPEGCGPYDTKAEAVADRRGMNRFKRYQNEEGFVTSDRREP